MERSRARRREEEARQPEEEESVFESAGVESLSVEMEGTEEEVVEGLEVALEMEIDEEGENKGKGEGKDEGDGTLRALEAIEFLTQEAEPSGKALVDDHNGFKELIRLAMLWTVQHCWPEGARFMFN